MYTIGIYSADFVMIKALRLADTSSKAEYLCDYYKSRLTLLEGQWIGYE